MPKINLGQAIVFILILIQIAFLLLNTLMRPPITYDNLAMWQYKPKVLFYENQINFDEQKYAYLGGGGHINYPWQTPLLSYWLYANLGEFNDLAGNLINLVYYLAILIIIYYFLRNYLSSLISLIFVWLFSTLPLPFYHAYNGYADLILSYYLLLAFTFLFYWLETREKKQLLASGVFFGCALFVKNDALIFAIAGLTVILIKSLIIDKKITTALKAGGFYSLAIILPLWPWLFFKAKYHLSFSNVGPGLGYHAGVWTNIYQALFLNNSFNIWWFAVIVSLLANVIKIKKQNSLLLGWLFLIFCFLGLAALYLLTEEYRFAIDNTALSRNLLALIPVSVVLTAVSFASKAGQPAE
ncbi:MAG: glycosyltransferase family 39 protein [Parcubacteria group bacterium]|nr:glycosyltransferase family 39 protein [Parcubacteria group bacterium]